MLAILSAPSEFAMAVLEKWATLLTGGLIIAAIAVFERAVLKTISRRLYLYLVGALLIVACFQAWKDQKDLAVSAASRLNEANDTIKNLSTGSQAKEIASLKDQLTKAQEDIKRLSNPPRENDLLYQDNRPIARIAGQITQ